MQEKMSKTKDLGEVMGVSSEMGVFQNAEDKLSGDSVRKASTNKVRAITRETQTSMNQFDQNNNTRTESFGKARKDTTGSETRPHGDDSGWCNRENYPLETIDEPQPDYDTCVVQTENPAPRGHRPSQARTRMTKTSQTTSDSTSAGPQSRQSSQEHTGLHRQFWPKGGVRSGPTRPQPKPYQNVPFDKTGPKPHRGDYL